MDKEMLTAEDIAEMLRIKVNTIHSGRWKARTGCPLQKVGKRLLADTAEFQRWFKNKKING